MLPWFSSAPIRVTTGTSIPTRRCLPPVLPDFSRSKTNNPGANLAHEIGHFWTSGSGPAANFLREGWATYVESLALEREYGTDTAKLFWKQHARKYFDHYDGRMALWESGNETNLNYDKGSWVFRMLEVAVGTQGIPAGDDGLFQTLPRRRGGLGNAGGLLSKAERPGFRRSPVSSAVAERKAGAAPVGTDARTHRNDRSVRTGLCLAGDRWRPPLPKESSGIWFGSAKARRRSNLRTSSPRCGSIPTKCCCCRGENARNPKVDPRRHLSLTRRVRLAGDAAEVRR